MLEKCGSMIAFSKETAGKNIILLVIMSPGTIHHHAIFQFVSETSLEMTIV